MFYFFHFSLKFCLLFCCFNCYFRDCNITVSPLLPFPSPKPPYAHSRTPKVHTASYFINCYCMYIHVCYTLLNINCRVHVNYMYLCFQGSFFGTRQPICIPFTCGQNFSIPGFSNFPLDGCASLRPCELCLIHVGMFTVLMFLQIIVWES